MTRETIFPSARGEDRYGPKASAWRKWVQNDLLGEAVVRAGRSIFIDSEVLDRRLAETGQLLVSNPNGDTDGVQQKSSKNRAAGQSTVPRGVR